MAMTTFMCKICEPRGDTIFIHTADCAKQDKKKLATLGVNVTSPRMQAR